MAYLLVITACVLVIGGITIVADRRSASPYGSLGMVLGALGLAFAMHRGGPVFMTISIVALVAAVVAHLVGLAQNKPKGFPKPLWFWVSLACGIAGILSTFIKNHTISANFSIWWILGPVIAIVVLFAAWRWSEHDRR